MKRELARCRSLAAACATLALSLTVSATARADVFDLTLNRLVLKPEPGGFANPNDSRNAAVRVPDAYRTALSELGVALAPKMLTTADTTGYNGFQFTADYSLTTISSKKCENTDPSVPEDRSECPWQYAAEGRRDGQGGFNLPPSIMHTLSVHARKGLWLVVVPLEIGAGATKLLQSDIFAVQVYAKLSLHEGFHRWPIPSFAVRGSAMRVIGASQVDLTMAQIDAQVSKSFGLFGSVTLVPYLGSAVLFIVARGQVLDLTPDKDAYKLGPGSEDLKNDAVFDSQDNIIRWRFFAGFRLQYHVLVLTTDFTITPCGDWNGSCGADRHKNNKFQDKASTQYTYSASAGFLF